MTIAACVFDAYGTLFDVAGAARREPALRDVWPRLAGDWRRKQLEYTWLRTIMGSHADFAQVTAEALDWALEAAGLTDPALAARLMALYRELPAYPEVPGMLGALKAGGMTTAILSNGTPAMLGDAARAAGIGGALDAIISVEALRCYKPAATVYRLATTRLGCAAEEILFVSSNGWDIAGAAAFGFRTVWVNRAGAPTDRLPARPAHVLRDLTPVPELVFS